MKRIPSPYTAAITGGGFLFEETNLLLPLLQSGLRQQLLKLLVNHDGVMITK